MIDAVSTDAGEQQPASFGGASGVGLLRIDADGYCTATNTAWRQMTGLFLAEDGGREWLDAVASADAEGLEAVLKGSAHEEFAREIRLNVPGGSVRKVLCTGLPLVGRDLNPDGYLLAVTDPTGSTGARVSVEDTAVALEQRVRELHCLFEISRLVERTGGMSIPKIVEGTVHLLPRALRYPETAYTRITLEGMLYETSAVTDAPWRECVEIRVHGSPAGVLEVGYLELPDSGSGRPLLDEESILIRSVAQRLGRMAERIKDAERLQENEEELRSRMMHMTRVAIVGEMAANIAHELNQPLTAITSYAEASRGILSREKKDLGKLTEALTWIAEEALRAGEIIRQMGDLVRPRQSLREKQDLNALILSINHLATLYARLHNVRVSMELADGLPPVTVDGVQMQQVVLNLIRNGIDEVSRTGSSEGWVIVRTEQLAGGEIQVSVEDNGRGLAQEDEEDVFRPFFTTKADGMGLGLSICKSIVNRHGGRIWYTPGPETGTIFHFTIGGR